MEVGFLRHNYDETNQGNVTKGENVQRECKAIEGLNASFSTKGQYMLDVTTEWG
jgi:hypothetical protein